MRVRRGTLLGSCVWHAWLHVLLMSWLLCTVLCLRFEPSEGVLEPGQKLNMRVLFTPIMNRDTPYSQVRSPLLLAVYSLISLARFRTTQMM